MTPALGLHAIAQFSALRILDSLIEGSVIAGLGALILRVTPRQNAAARFTVWFSTLVAIAAMPLIAAWTPHRIISEALTRPTITVPESWALYLFGAWALIAGYSLVGVARAMWHLHVLRKSCSPIDPAELEPILRETLHRHRTKGPVQLCTSDQLKVPTAIGLMKPAVVIPRWVMHELSASELNQILLHELAHLRRRDDWTNLIQQVVKALFFFHPAVWWIERKIALEREMACDDAVLAETDSPRAYAECLAHLAQRSFVHRSLALAQAVLGRIRQTSLRVAEILDVNRPTRSSGTWKPAVSLVAGFAIACAVLGAKAPRLVGFQGDALRRASSPTNAARSWQASYDSPSWQAMPRATNASLTTSSPRIGIIPAKFGTGTSPHSHKVQAHTAAIHNKASRPEAAKMVHMTSVDSSFVPFTETLFVVIEDGGSEFSEQPVYRIQLWHVLTFQQVLKPASHKAPQKET
jgi:beta-lactamase regulating signal transducer with metallopeptidase domain